MDNNNSDNHFELFSRRHSSRDVPTINFRDASINANNDPRTKRYSLSADIDPISVQRLNRMSANEYNASAISIISGSRSNIDATAHTLSSKSKSKRKKSFTGSDITEKSDSSSKANRLKGRNALTSSFLRRKRIEYAGNDIEMYFYFFKQLFQQFNKMF